MKPEQRRRTVFKMAIDMYSIPPIVIRAGTRLFLELRHTNTDQRNSERLEWSLVVVASRDLYGAQSTLHSVATWLEGG